MPGEGMFDDGQAQARAPGLARAAAVHAVEALGEAGNVLGFDADARVFHREFGALLGASPYQAHLAPRRRITDGVARKVAERAGELGLGSQEVESRLGVER